MKNLEINDMAFELCVRVYCNACGSWYDPRKEMNKDRVVSCSHPSEKQRYKSTIDVVRGFNKRVRKSKVYETRDLKEVILKAMEFKLHVIENVKIVESLKLEKQKRPMLLIDCLAMFLDFKHDNGVVEHEKRMLSIGSLTSFENYITKWKEATKIAGEDFKKLRVDNITVKNVAATIKYLSQWGNSVNKKAFGFYNQFYKFLNENGYNIRPPFKGIEVSDAKDSDGRAVTYDEFQKIKKAFREGTSKDKLRGRGIHFGWLVEALDFRALTGRRREEFMIARFSDIKLVNGELLGGYIKMLDGKYSKQNKHKIKFKPRYTKAPIFPELRDFLIEMGYEKHKGTDRYIVAGDEIKQRDTLANNLTNAFGFYRDKIGMGAEVRLNGLRDGYVTRMRNEFGDNSSFFTGHTPGRTDKKHYYDDKELFEKVKKFRLWKKK